MSDNSRISWTDATWSPVTGCTRISEGCTRCYIERTPPFRMARRRFRVRCAHCEGSGFEPMAGKWKDSHCCSVCRGDGDVESAEIGSTTGVELHPDRLGQPLRWRKPRRVFVCSMADLFHDDVPDEYIARVFTAMAMAPQHTFQVLTKRPARMRSLLRKWSPLTGIPPWVFTGPWPLPNVWLGVSTETQQWADIRIPLLLDTPAAVRWVSAEPLLGAVDLCNCYPGGFLPSTYEGVQEHCNIHGRNGVSWLVVGGESGPGARPMHPDWARSLRDQCQQNGVAFHFKQWGEWIPDGYSDEHGWHANIPRDASDPRRLVIHPAGMTALHPTNPFDPFRSGHPNWGMAMRRVGSKAAGRLLDGLTWNEYPDA